MLISSTNMQHKQLRRTGCDSANVVSRLINHVQNCKFLSGWKLQRPSALVSGKKCNRLAQVAATANCQR
jgi:hypothetical protein